MNRVLLLIFAILFTQCGTAEREAQSVLQGSEWIGKYLHGGFGPGLEAHLEILEDGTFKCSGEIHHGKFLFVEGVWVESDGWIYLTASEIPTQYKSLLGGLKQCCVNDERVLLPGGDESVFEGGKIYAGAFWEGDSPREFEADFEGSWAMTFGTGELEDA